MPISSLARNLRSYPHRPGAIRDHFPLEDGDVVIIGTGNSPEKAEDGAFAAAAFLLMNEE